MTTIHSTADWDETTCGLSLWDEIPNGDVVLGHDEDPARSWAGQPLCVTCFPPEESERRASLYRAADATRIPWEKQQEALAAILAAKEEDT